MFLFCWLKWNFALSVARTFFWKITETFPNYGITDFSRQITEVTTFLAQNYGKITKI